MLNLVFIETVFILALAMYTWSLHMKIIQYKKMALYDALTGVANKRLFNDRLNMAMNSRNPFHLVAIDVNNLKKLNDSKGHTAGDQLIVDVAVTLEQSIRVGDTVARIGGDEFMLIIPDTAKGVKNKIMNRIAANMEAQNLSVSIGCARFPTQASCRDKLINLADEKMYQHKRKQKAAGVCHA